MALTVGFEIRTSDFLASGNVAAILDQAAVLGLLAGGLTICLVLGQFDLSIGYTASICGLVCSGLMSAHHVSWPVAVLVSLALGAVIGLVNGLIVALLKINALLATLATGSILAGVSSWYSITPFSVGIPSTFANLGLKTWGWLPLPAVIAGVVLLLTWVYLQHTPSGRRMYAVGGNREAARIAGLNVPLMTIGAFVACAVLSAAGGILLTAELGSGQPGAAVGLLLNAFAAAFLGSATWREGEFHVGGTVIGVLILGVVFSGLSLLSPHAYLNDIITGAIMVIAVGVSSILKSSANS